MPGMLPFTTQSHNAITPPSPSSSESESFHEFFDQWIAEQHQLLQQLVSAAKSPPNHSESELRALTNRVLAHFDRYYQLKSQSARRDVLSILTPPWRSRLEDAFLWIGGWRPSTAFHLLYSKSGLQFEARLAELLRGGSTGDLGELSPSQLARVDELQRQALREEKEASEAMAEQQETVADATMVDLAQAMGEALRGGAGGRESFEERVDSALAPKEEALRGVLGRADDLRMRTLRSVTETLTPIQAVHFLVAAAELHIWVHEWGKKRDAAGPTGDLGQDGEAHIH